MDRIFGLENNFSGRNLSREGRKEEIEDKKKREKKHDNLQGSSESGPPSEQINEMFETCLWMTIDELMTREIVKIYENTRWKRFCHFTANTLTISCP